MDLGSKDPLLLTWPSSHHHPGGWASPRLYLREEMGQQKVGKISSSLWTESCSRTGKDSLQRQVWEKSPQNWDPPGRPASADGGGPPSVDDTAQGSQGALADDIRETRVSPSSSASAPTHVSDTRAPETWGKHLEEKGGTQQGGRLK